MNKEPTKDMQEEFTKLPDGSSLEFHSSHKSEMKEGHNAISGTFWGCMIIHSNLLILRMMLMNTYARKA